jgi:transcriptional regulator of acetoin/glycerol metabolism
MLESAAERSPSAVTAVRWVCPGARTRYLKLDRNEIDIGRAPDVAARLDASGVSRLHAAFTRQGPVFALSDKASTNGTYVNGQRVSHTAISAGDVLRFGDMLGVVVRVPADYDPDASDVEEVLPGVVFGPGLRAVLTTLRAAASSDVPILIEGETGTGKECVARVVHALSGRDGPLHAVNCAAIPGPIADTELFGHKKGSFTGADQSGLGHVRAADGGTLFLDELADLDLTVQAKLLRVIQEREVMPIGETRASDVNVRFLAAIQSPLADLVNDKRLRPDLAMRLKGVTLRLPPLRERREDIGALLVHLLHKHSGGRSPELEARALEGLLLYDWPGNVRELELVVRNMLVVHGTEPVLRRSMLPAEMLPAESVSQPPPGPAGSNRAEHDLLQLGRALSANGMSLSRAAESAGISRQRAYRLLKGRSPEQLVLELGDALKGGTDEPDA